MFQIGPNYLGESVLGESSRRASVDAPSCASRILERIELEPAHRLVVLSDDAEWRTARERVVRGAPAGAVVLARGDAGVDEHMRSPRCEQRLSSGAGTGWGRSAREVDGELGASKNRSMVSRSSRMGERRSFPAPRRRGAPRPAVLARARQRPADRRSASIRTKDVYLAAQDARLRPRHGHKKALGAVKHSILIACWHMLSTGELYNDLGGGYFRKRNPERITKRLVTQPPSARTPRHTRNACRGVEVQRRSSGVDGQMVSGLGDLTCVRSAKSVGSSTMSARRLRHAGWLAAAV
jgi:hypothetical protein